MGIASFIKSQFIEVIEWVDDTQDTMVYRFPVLNKEIKMGAKLTVRESQMAVFINEGKATDVFGPGLYTLSTENLPVLTKLRSWPYGFNSPFKAEVYFINTKQFTDQKWGTENPIMMRDAEFGMLRLRAFGIYSFRVGFPLNFLQQVSGTNGVYDIQSITGQLKRAIVSGLTDLLGEWKVPALDLARDYDEISAKAKEKLTPRFEELGLMLTSFYVENISLPEAVEKALDRRTEMGVLGDVHQYTQFQAADAIRDAAQNPGGGMAAAGVGLGAGAVLGNVFGQSMMNMTPGAAAPQTPSQVEQFTACPACKAQVPAGSKFCPSCGGAMAPAKEKCVKCGAEIEPGSKFCPQCGAPQLQETVCKNCGAKLAPGSKFCPECGTKAE